MAELALVQDGEEPGNEAGAPNLRLVEDRGRIAVMFMANLRIASFPNPIRIRVQNISKGGLQGAGVIALPVGAPLVIELPNIAPVSAQLVWSQGGIFGLEFDRPIDTDAVLNKVSGDFGRYTDPSGTDMRAIL